MLTSAVTHRGLKRPDNQDRWLIKEIPGGGLLLAVADGMGGEAYGDLAAQMAVDALDGHQFTSQTAQADLAGLLVSSCKEIASKSEANPELEGMGTTLTAALVSDNRAIWAHVGDSRLYLLRDGKLTQITEDHTAVAMLVEDGRLSREEAKNHPARHILMECLGSGDCQPDTGGFRLQPGDLLLLSSDGLHDKTPGRTLASILMGPGGLQNKVENLLQAALDTGGRDNITAVVLQVPGDGK